MSSFLRGFWITFAVMAAAFCTPLLSGFPAAFAPGAGIAVGVAAVAADRTTREAVLRRIARRPVRRMTPQDYARTAELERELGWEPSGPCAPVKVPPATGYCRHCRNDDVSSVQPRGVAPLGSYCLGCGRQGRALTGACGKYREPSGSLIPPGALERILAEAPAAGGEAQP